MRQIILIVLLFSILQIKGQANHYHPFPNSNAVWSESYFVFPGNAPPEQCSWYQYTMGNDTIIGANTYIKIYKSGLFGSYQCPTPPGQNPSGGTFDSSYVGGLMQDSINKKVYFLSAGSISTSTATLLYDFSLSAGDSISYPPSFSGGPNAKITSIDSVLVGTKYHKRFNLGGTSGIYPNAAIIVGVGGTFGLLESPMMAEAAGWGLGCFQHYADFYPSSIASCPLIARPSTIGIKKITNANKISIYPNPNNGVFIIELNSAEKQTMQVYDINGKMVLSQVINNKTTIDASILNEGVYNISITNSIGITNKRLIIVR